MRLVYYDVGLGFLADSHKIHAIDELRNEGHDVIYVNPMEILGAEAPIERYCEILLDKVRAEHEASGVDMFFSVAWDGNITPETVREISRMGIPTVSFSTDDLSHPFRVKKITPSFDLCWSSVHESAGILRSYGARNLVVMPFAANPYLFKPHDAPERNAVCFIGTAYGARAHGIASLAQAGVPIEVHGASPMDVYGTGRTGSPFTRALTNASEGWHRLAASVWVPGGRKCVHAALKRTMLELVSDPPEKHPMKGTVEYLGPAGNEEMFNLLSRSAISFGSLEVASTYVLKNPLLFIRFREFEAPMAGGVHLVNRVPELEGYFEEDKEMLFYDSTEELIDKARFYLRPEQTATRNAIREKAAMRARAEHTWSHRFRRLAEELGIGF